METQTQSQIPLSRFQLGVLWATLFLIVADWLPFFLTMLLHFYSIRNLNVGTAVLIMAYFLAPLVTLLLSKAAEKSRAAIVRVSGWLLPVLTALAGILMIVWYFQYYQLTEALETEFEGFTSVTPVVGNFSQANPELIWLFLAINGILCLGILPLLFILIGYGQGILHFSHATSRGLTFVAIYFLFRFGGFPGTMLRLGFTFLVITQLSIVGLLHSEKGQLAEQWQKSNLPYHETLVVLVMFAFAIGAANLGVHGLLFQSWMWVAVLVSSILIEIPVISQELSKSPAISKTILALLPLMLILLLGAQFISLLLYIQPVLVTVGLFLAPFYVKCSFSLYRSSQQQKREAWNVHPLRHLLLNFWFLLGFLIPLLATLVDPVTEIAVLVLGIIEFILVWRSQRLVLAQTRDPQKKL